MSPRDTSERDAEVARVDAIIADGESQYDEMGAEIVETATCLTCFRTWNDAKISGLTPAPSGRCPYEYAHHLDHEAAVMRWRS